jgi:hypothetical protein
MSSPPQEVGFVLFRVAIHLEISFQIMYTVKTLLIHILMHELLYLDKSSVMSSSKSEFLNKELAYFCYTYP